VITAKYGTDEQIAKDLKGLQVVRIKGDSYYGDE